MFYLGPSSGGVGHERGATILESPGASEANSHHVGSHEPPSDDDDLHVFRRAVADVRPLAPRTRATAWAATATDRWRVRARRTRGRAPREPRRARRSRGARDGRALSFRRPSVRDDVLRKLKRGQFAIEAEIDLHGSGGTRLTTPCDSS